MSGSVAAVEVDSPSSGGELVTALVVVVWALAVERHTAKSQPLLVAQCRQIARVGCESAAAGMAFAVPTAVTAPCLSGRCGTGGDKLSQSFGRVGQDVVSARSS